MTAPGHQLSRPPQPDPGGRLLRGKSHRLPSYLESLERLLTANELVRSLQPLGLLMFATTPSHCGASGSLTSNRSLTPMQLPSRMTT
jgi:hypothetical protein